MDQISKGDDKNTRRAKRSARNKFKRKSRKYDPNRTNATSSQYKQEYDKDIEEFVRINKRIIRTNQGKYIELNHDFCLFNNPSSALYRLACLIQYSKSNSQKSKVRYKDKISFGALYLLDSFCYRIRERKPWALSTSNLSVEDFTFLKNLKSFQDKSTSQVNSKIVNSRVRIDRDNFELKKREYDKKSKEVRDLVEGGIRESEGENKSLSIEEHNVISSSITEHFDNIFQHAKRAKFGNVCGYYNKFNSEVRIIIYNFGETIYENLSGSLPADMQRPIDEVLSNHTKKNFFGMNSTFTKENALTLLALQEGISSKIEEDKSRGHGLIDFIEHVFNLSNKSKIRLISGRTAIKIDENYRISSMNFLGRDRRIIAFNKSNNIFEMPDKEYLENISVKFPGVIIETLIPLKKE